MTLPNTESYRCYFAVYAGPTAPSHVTIEGGRFGNRNTPKNMIIGSMVLLYCTSSYLGHAKTIPGIGLVTLVDRPVAGILVRLPAIRGVDTAKVCSIRNNNRGPCSFGERPQRMALPNLAGVVQRHTTGGEAN